MLISENLELGTTDEREHAPFVFVDLVYFTQCEFSGSIHLPENFIAYFAFTVE